MKQDSPHSQALKVALAAVAKANDDLHTPITQSAEDLRATISLEGRQKLVNVVEVEHVQSRSSHDDKDVLALSRPPIE